jgi:hypothetical protein
MVRDVEVGDTLIYGPDAADVVGVNGGTVNLVRSDAYGHMPLEVAVDIEDVSITSPGGNFIGSYGRINGSVSTSENFIGDSQDDSQDASQDTEDEDDHTDGQDAEPTQATLSGYTEAGN